MKFVAIINVPGYLPMDDEPPVFDTAQEAWAYLADEREHAEDGVPDDKYSDTWRYLLRLAAGEHRHGDPSEVMANQRRRHRDGVRRNPRPRRRRARPGSRVHGPGRYPRRGGSR